MKLGLFTPIFGALPLDDMLERLKRHPQVQALELGTGGWPGAAHIEVEKLLASQAEVIGYKRKLENAGLAISALSCHGNPVHPDPDVAKRDQRIFEHTLRLAERLEVRTVVTFSGCPGGGPKDLTPNWITVAWPPEFSEALVWQWEERLIPYWKTAVQLAESAGIRVALEAHPGFSVYNPESLLKLRQSTSPNLGINLDPSHLWWQGIDIPTAIAELGDAIFHVHAKDVALNPNGIARNGVLDTKSYHAMQVRAWTFRSVGWGHDEFSWKGIVSALRLAGYDGVLSIEHEDALISIEEGLGSALGLLERVLLTEKPVEAWWA